MHVAGAIYYDIVHDSIWHDRKYKFITKHTRSYNYEFDKRYRHLYSEANVPERKISLLVLAD